MRFLLLLVLLASDRAIGAEPEWKPEAMASKVAYLIPIGPGITSIDVSKMTLFSCRADSFQKAFASSEEGEVRSSLAEKPRTLIVLNKDKKPLCCIVWSPWLMRGRFYKPVEFEYLEGSRVQWALPFALTLQGYVNTDEESLHNWFREQILNQQN